MITKLKCFAEDNLPDKLYWIELSANNIEHEGPELSLCDTVSFQEWSRRRSLANESELANLEFQCVAVRGRLVGRVNHTVRVDQIEPSCRASLQPSGMIALCQVDTIKPA